jgi:hypothetical protein
MRIGGEAPRRRTHSRNRFQNHGLLRVTATSDAFVKFRELVLSQTLSHAARSTTPAGTSPAVARYAGLTGAPDESGSSSRPLPASLATPAVDLRDRSAHSLNRPPWIKRQTLADAAANDKARTVINPMSQSLP